MVWDIATQAAAIASSPITSSPTAVEYLYTNPCDLINCILWANTATGSGPQIYRSAGQSGNIQYCDIQGGWTGTGNINVDPSLNTSFHLNVRSWCMEAGNNSYATGTKDIDAQTRVYDGDGNGTATVDMGTNEYRPRRMGITFSEEKEFRFFGESGRGLIPHGPFFFQASKKG